MPDLYTRSIEMIRANQHPSGAYVACPNFPSYRYCWFRDGSFVAYAMGRAGELESAANFHAWAARAVNQRQAVVRRALSKAAASEPLTENDVLHTRLTLEGADGTLEFWENFQLDGFGTWLWALNEHRKLSGASLPAEWLAAARLSAEYLAGLWPRPNYDCWEEHAEAVHPHTLAAIYGGLQAYCELVETPRRGVSTEPAGAKPAGEEGEATNILADGGYDFASPLREIREYIERHFVFEGHFVKFEGAPEVDASLLGLAVPYGVFEASDPRMLATAAEIERTLRCGASGVRRYPADTYYGGGEWILLAAWLGWYYAALPAGMAPVRQIEAIRTWIEAQAGPDGSLPEQVPVHLNDPAYYPSWVARRGPVASPLLWSHAEYMILKDVLLPPPQPFP